MHCARLISSNSLSLLDVALRRAASFLIRVYKHTLGHFLGGHCRFHPSCSNYALEAYRKRSFPRATAMTAWRILRCNPLCRGGYDPVDEADREDQSISGSAPHHER